MVVKQFVEREREVGEDDRVVVKIKCFVHKTAASFTATIILPEADICPLEVMLENYLEVACPRLQPEVPNLAWQAGMVVREKVNLEDCMFVSKKGQPLETMRYAMDWVKN
jgi:hypothetical protein